MGTVAEEWSLLPPGDNQEEAVSAFFTLHIGRSASVMNRQVGDDRRQWIQRHAERLLQHWRQRESPLGITPDYLRQLERDLARCYDQPLMRTFVEKTY